MTDYSAPVTLADVARLAEVSKMTVSNVINNKPGMSEGTRLRVLDAIEHSGYVANTAARMLAGRRMNLIGVITPRYSVPYTTELIQGASAAAEDAGLTIAVFTTSDNPALERDRSALLRTMADGVLLILPTTDDHQIFEGVVPVVTAGAPGPYSVQGDNEQGGRLAAQHLLSLGHRRIAHVRGAGIPATHRSEMEARERGFVEVLSAAGLSIPDEYFQEGDSLESGGLRAGTALLKLAVPPTAIFAANDSSAFGVLRAAEGLGVRVPEQLSVIGFDDVASSARTTPALTTVRQPLQEMGRLAVEMLLGLFKGQVPAIPHPLFPTTLIVRHSTCPPDPSRTTPRTVPAVTAEAT